MILIKPIHIENELIQLTEYVGARDELMAEGMATEAMFPVGRKLTALGSFTDDHHWAIRRIRGGKFRMRVWRPKDDKPDEPTPRRAENEAVFREEAMLCSGAVLKTLIEQIAQDDAYRYDAESLRAIRLHAHRLLEAVEKGRIVKVAASRGKVVRLDQWRRPPMNGDQD
jgi:hypothetical protein